SRTYMLKIRLRQRRLVSRQGCLTCGAAGGKENKGTENREQEYAEVTTLSVGQCVSPGRVIISYSQFGKNKSGSQETRNSLEAFVLVIQFMASWFPDSFFRRNLRFIYARGIRQTAFANTGGH